MSAHPTGSRSYVGRHRRAVPVRGLTALLSRMRQRRSFVSVLRLIIVLVSGRS